MSNDLKRQISDHMQPDVRAIGFAPVERFADAPPGHQPGNACKNAKTVIVFGLPVPRGILRSPDYNLYFLHRTYHTVYRNLDELALRLCNFIESTGDHLAVPVPSYAPMVFKQMVPWGLMSLKHAAVQAGLGAFGRSGQMYHPKYGSMLRLSAVITSAELPGDPLIEKDPCPPACVACQELCPSGAFDSEGAFDKMICLRYTVKHAIYPLALRDAKSLEHIERVVNTAGHDYWLSCDECLKACPLNR
jgi:epoxyqueuosine reductase QueG